MIDYPQGTEVEIPGIPEDTKYLADRLDRIDAHLKEIADATMRRESISPTILEVITENALLAGEVFGRRATSVRVRVTGLVATVSASGTILTLLIGTRRYPIRVPNVTVYIPFPIVVDAGVDIAASSSVAQAAGLTGFYVIGYPDES